LKRVLSDGFELPSTSDIEPKELRETCSGLENTEEYELLAELVGES
jgi:hypothetical protein